MPPSHPIHISTVPERPRGLAARVGAPCSMTTSSGRCLARHRPEASLVPCSSRLRPSRCPAGDQPALLLLQGEDHDADFLPQRVQPHGPVQPHRVPSRQLAVRHHPGGRRTVRARASPTTVRSRLLTRACCAAQAIPLHEDDRARVVAQEPVGEGAALEELRRGARADRHTA